MSHALTETPTKGSTVTVPDDGDGATGASVEAPFQALANRVKWAENALDTSGGNHAIKDLNALAALTSVSTPANNDIRLVSGYGLYRFVSGDTTTPFSPWVVTHASGRWFHALYSALSDATVGATIATLTAGKLPLDRHTNGIYSLGETEWTGTWGNVADSKTSASYADTTLTHTISALEVGDQVLLHGELIVSASALSVDTRCRLKTIEDFGGTPVAVTYPSTEWIMEDTTKRQIAFRKLITVGTAGTFQALVQLQGNGADAGRVHYPSRLSSFVVRP